MEKKCLIPDWSAQSLRAAYKRFGHYTKKEFIKKACIDDSGKKFWYTHVEEVPPVFGPGYNPEETAEKTSKKKENGDLSDSHSDKGKQSDDENDIQFLL